MTRVLSGAVLIVLAVGVVWAAPSPLFLALAGVLVVLACREYAGLAEASGLRIPLAVSTTAALLTAASFAGAALGGTLQVPLDVVLMSAFVAIGALSLGTWQGGRDAVASVSAAILPALYLGLPIGAMIAVREVRGPGALLLLMLTVSSSDTAQFYSGRAFGRRLLSPVISPKKTIAGAVGGFITGAVVLAVGGAWWLPAVPVPLRALIGVAIVALGIAGDLFESMLKRSAGVKDSSSLIPGHGGILDRIDALLFAAPIYYVVLRYV